MNRPASAARSAADRTRERAPAVAATIPVRALRRAAVARSIAAPAALLASLAWGAAATATDGAAPASPPEARVIVPDPESIPSLPGYVAERVPAPVLGDEVYVVEAGPADAPTLVLIHGVSRTGAHDWYAVLPELAKRYRVLTFDLPGFHRSSGGNKRYDPVSYAEFVLALAAQRRPGPFLLVGHSMGGAIALEVAARGGDRVERLMLVDVAGILHPKAFYHAAIDRQHAKLGGFARVFDGVRDRARDAADLVSDAYAELAQAAALRSEWLRGFLMSDDPSRVAALALMAHDFGPALDGVTAPTLLVWGGADEVAPLRTARAISSRLGNAPLVVLDGVAHVPMREAPERFDEIALAWLAGAGPAATGPEPGADVGEATDAEKDGECRDRRNVTFEGRYRQIEIDGCRDVLLRNVYANRLILRDAVVTIESPVIESPEIAVTAVRSELTVSGGRIRGATAIESLSSDLDLAGTTLEGSEASLLAREGETRLLCSVCRLESPQGRGDLHDRIDLAPGAKR
jgi:pimeloyl-ACP methyl ester carboxylesterase